MTFIANVLVSALKLVGVACPYMINLLNLRPKRLTSNFAKRGRGIFLTLIELYFDVYFDIKVNLSFYANFFTDPVVVTSLLIT